MFTFGSLFAGIGGFDLGFERTAMACSWQVEIDDAATGILTQHWPKVPRFRDVRTCGSHNLAPVDLIAGGFPCQDVSVAGRRKGLAGERSGLWFEFHRVLAELAPRWVVIENVPGLLSSRQGQDFAVILRGLAELGYLSAWRILDAQYFGVAQRRRRVFIIGHLGDGCAAEVLFERTSRAWDPPPSREAGTGVADPITKSFTKHHGRSAGKDSYPRNAIVAWDNAQGDPNAEKGGPAFAVNPQMNQGVAIGLDRTRGTVSGDIAGTLRANSAQAPGVNDGKADNQCVAYTIQTNDGGDHKRKDRPEGGMYVKEADKSLTLGSSDQTLVAHALSTRPGGRMSAEDDYVLAVSENQRAELRLTEYSRQLTTGGGKPGQGYPCVLLDDGLYLGEDLRLRSIGVRRLTPVECERLQGFPDNWTAGQSDSRRYKQLGNAVCVPVAEWLGGRIMESSRLRETHST